MGNRQLNTQELEILETETDLDRKSIIKAFEKFKMLAGDKGYVSIQDITPLIQNVPIYDEIAAILKSSDSGKEQEVDFRQLINVIAALREKNSMMTYKYLFRVYDKNGDEF